MTRLEAWFAGVDWASEAHHVCVVGGDGSKREERIFRHGGAGLAELAEWIAAKSGGSAPDIPVAVEVPHEPVVESLMDRGFAVYAINPKQLDRFRDRFSPAGAKDDSLDPRVLADALKTDHHFWRIDPVDPTVIELRAWALAAHARHRDAVYHWARVAGPARSRQQGQVRCTSRARPRPRPCRVTSRTACSRSPAPCSEPRPATGLHARQRIVGPDLLSQRGPTATARGAGLAARARFPFGSPRALPTSSCAQRWARMDACGG